jgi:hypothetical protein
MQNCAPVQAAGPAGAVSQAVRVLGRGDSRTRRWTDRRKIGRREVRRKHGNKCWVSGHNNHQRSGNAPVPKEPRATCQDLGSPRLRGLSIVLFPIAGRGRKLTQQRSIGETRSRSRSWMRCHCLTRPFPRGRPMAGSRHLRRTCIVESHFARRLQRQCLAQHRHGGLCDGVRPNLSLPRSRRKRPAPFASRGWPASPSPPNQPRSLCRRPESAAGRRLPSSLPRARQTARRRPWRRPGARLTKAHIAAT